MGGRWMRQGVRACMHALRCVPFPLFLPNFSYSRGVSVHGSTVEWLSVHVVGDV
jgi:hypothetical protein